VPFISWDTAGKVAAQVRADDRRAEEITRQRAAEHERHLEHENERLRAEAAVSAPQRVLHGVELSTPGEEARPGWMDE
jgi:hypothetical protein